MLIAAFALILFSCGGEKSQPMTYSTPNAPAQSEAPAAAPADPMANKGVGPVSSVTLGDIDATLVDKGKVLFEGKCSACHKLDKRAVGPALADVTKRRSPEWIMNMILDPEKMTKEDPIAKGLFEEFMTPMANQSLTEEEARAILEYFRDTDK